MTQIIAGASLPPSHSFLSPFHPSNNPSSHRLLPQKAFSVFLRFPSLCYPPASCCVCICPGFPSRDERISRSDVLDNCRTPESPGIETTQPAAFSQCFYHDSDRRRYLSNKELTLLIRIHCLSLSLLFVSLDLLYYTTTCSVRFMSLTFHGPVCKHLFLTKKIYIGHSRRQARQKTKVQLNQQAPGCCPI